MNKVLKSTPKPTVVTVGVEPTPLPENPLSNRIGLIITNNSSVNLLLTDNEDTDSFPIYPKETIHFDAPDTVTIYAKVETGTAEISILELH